MSKLDEFVARLSDTAQTTAQLVIATGESSKTVGNRLQVAKARGLVVKTASGWILAPAAPKIEMTPPAAPRKAAKRKKRDIAVSLADEAVFSFFLDEDCDVQIARRDGMGEAAIIPRQEALRLRDFLNQFGEVMRSA